MKRAASLFAGFVESTRHLAGPLGAVTIREAPTAMLQNRLRQAAAAREIDLDELVSQVVQVATARAERRPPPIYIAGMGGSGSRWLGAMLGAMPTALDVEEAVLAGDLGGQIEALSVEEQGFAVDCLHLAHASAALGRRPLEQLLDARIVNSGIPTIEPRHGAWDPNRFAIYLLRDPRDQVACFAFRKPKFKSRLAPDASEEQFLAACAAENARNHELVSSSPLSPDFVCRYEELRSSAPRVLAELVDAIGLPAEPGTVAEVAREHDADLMRRGEVTRKGDLSPERSRGWRRETDERQKLVLHARLVEVVAATDYPMDDCTGRRLPLHGRRPARRLRFGRDDELGTLFARDPGDTGGDWSRLGEARGEIAVTAGTELKLRVSERAGAEAIRSLRELPADALDSLCLAGNPSLDDGLLGACVASLGDLREIDLARTGVTDRCVETLAALDGLRSASLFESDATAAGIVRLRESLGPAAHLAS